VWAVSLGLKVARGIPHFADSVRNDGWWAAAGEDGWSLGWMDLGVDSKLQRDSHPGKVEEPESLWHGRTLSGPTLWLASPGVLYVGVTSDLASRVLQHQSNLIPGFTQKYGVTKLVWFEAHSSVRAAISREKMIKGWSRMKKVRLIGEHNSTWKDLSQG